MKRILLALLFFGAFALGQATTPGSFVRFPYLPDLFAPPLEATYRPTIIKSIQGGTLTLTGAGATSNTATITAVTTANSSLSWVGSETTCTGSSDWRDGGPVLLTFTNSTTITGTRVTAVEACDVSATYRVVEFYGGIIKSVQRGSITSGTATISAVTTAKTSLTMTGWQYNGSSGIVGLLSGYPRLILTNSTTITLGGGGAGMSIGYQALEFK